MIKEIRNVANQLICRQNKIGGYAARFNEFSEIMTSKNGEKFKEIILPTAITNDTIKNSDIFCLLNHNKEKVLGRSKFGKGNLKITIDNYGLFYEFEAFDDDLSKHTYEMIKNKVIESSSFAFSVNPNDKGAQQWSKENGIYIRTIKKIDKLYDVSPVYKPAYATSTCTIRSIKELMQNQCNDIQIKLQKILDRAKELAEK